MAGAPFPVSAQQEETKKNAAARAWNRRRSLDGKTIKVHSRRWSRLSPGNWSSNRRTLRITNPEPYCAHSRSKTSSCCSSGIPLIQSHFLRPGSTQDRIRDPTGTPRSDQAPRLTENALAPTSPGRQPGDFSTDFAYPTIFAEDPRYYRLIHGSGRQRFFHAVEHTFVAQRDSGKHMFNISQWLGTATAVGLSDVYHPGNERGLTPALRVSGYALAVSMGTDVLREFWPDIARKFRMPFRDTGGPR